MTYDPAVLREFIAAVLPKNSEDDTIDYVVQWSMRGPLSAAPATVTREEGVVLATLAFLQGQPEKQECYQNLISKIRSKRKAEILKLFLLLAENRENFPEIPAIANLEFSKSAPVHTPQPSPQPSPRAVSFATVPEPLLVRDLVFCFQGIDGNFLKFDGEKFDIDADLPSHVKLCLLRLAEVGTLYKRLTLLLSQDRSLPQIALVLHASVRNELSNYQAMTVLLDAKSEEWSLLKLSAWICIPLLKLRNLHALLIACKGLRGGALLSQIYKFSLHGGFGGFCSNILAAVNRPLLEMTTLWLTEGVKNDPHAEFFVKQIGDASSVDLWRGGFSLDEKNIPCFIPHSVCLEILKAGKSVRFIRSCCSEADWLDSGTLEISGNLSDSIVEFWEQIANVVSSWAKTQNANVVELLLKKYALRKNLESVRRYLLLGQGDFVQSLLDVAGETLALPSRQIFKHQLLSLLDAAVRQSNAQYHDREMLDRLDCQVATAAAESGWEVFALDFRVTAPVSVVLTAECMRGLRRISGFVWRLCRCEFQLTNCWELAMGRQHKLQAKLENGEVSVMSRASGPTGLDALLHKCNCMRHDIWHFLHNLRSYACYDVIDAFWQKFEFELSECKDLDSLIFAQELFLQRSLEGLFLGGGASDEILEIVNRLLSAAARFANTQETLFGDLAGGAETERIEVMHGVLDEVRSAFLNDMTKFIGLLELPREPGAAQIEELHACLVSKLNFNDYFTKWARS